MSLPVLHVHRQALLEHQLVELRTLGAEVGCHSTKRPDGTPMGKATEQCDVAIDLQSDAPPAAWRCPTGATVEQERNPMPGTLCRLKFTVTDPSHWS